MRRSKVRKTRRIFFPTAWVYEDDFVQNLAWTFSRANRAEIRHVIRRLESRFHDMKVNAMHKRNPAATVQKTTNALGTLYRFHFTAIFGNHKLTYEKYNFNNGNGTKSAQLA